MAQRLVRCPSIGQRIDIECDRSGLGLSMYTKIGAALQILIFVRNPRRVLVMDYLSPLLFRPATRDVQPRLVQCWASVADAGSTLNKPWVNAS